MKSIKKLFIFIISIGVLSLLIVNNDKLSYAFSFLKDDNIKVFKSDDNIVLHFIDVGQGDAIFIELPNDETMLIDAGEVNYGELVYNYINKYKYDNITYLIGTHPHSDHIGGLPYLIDKLNISKVYLPKAVTTTNIYEKLLTTIKNKNLKVTAGKSGLNIINKDNLIIDIIAPNSVSYNDLNNYSIVLKITYGNNSFLLMGDAETLSEKEITSDVKSDLIKVGHHGSDSSSSLSFLKKVNPTYGIIMVGADNKYNLPKSAIIKRYESLKVNLYRTDINGNIVVTSDGNEINIKTSK